MGNKNYCPLPNTPLDDHRQARPSLHRWGYGTFRIATDNISVVISDHAGGLNGPARSTVILARSEHGPTRVQVGRAGTRPVTGRAWALPQAQRASPSTTRLAAARQAWHAARLARSGRHGLTRPSRSAAHSNPTYPRCI